jgi:DNA polymerase III epsilon subunit-like protein
MIGRNINLTPDQIIEDSKIICAAYKWSGEDKTHEIKFKVTSRDDKRVVKQMRDLIDEADVSIAHNGDRFDVRMLEKRIIDHRLDPLQGLVTIDTLKLSRKTFRFPSHKLDYIAQRLGLGAKTETGGFGLWKRVMEGDRSAVDHMSYYCAHDVELLEQVYETLAPYVGPKAANMSLLTNYDQSGCPTCGATNVQQWGRRALKGGIYQRYRCNDCSYTWRDTRKVK